MSTSWGAGKSCAKSFELRSFERSAEKIDVPPTPIDFITVGRVAFFVGFVVYWSAVTICCFFNVS